MVAACTCQPTQMEDVRSGQRVRIKAGAYRVGRTSNAHVVVAPGATGTVRVVHRATRLNPARVLVSLDQPANPWAPRTAMVPRAELEAA